jgi:hypothetical protein
MALNFCSKRTQEIGKCIADLERHNHGDEDFYLKNPEQRKWKIVSTSLNCKKEKLG